MKEHTHQPIVTLHNLLDYDISKFFNAEVLLKNIIPEWINKASSVKLKEVLQRYEGFIQQHAEDLEKFIEEEGINALSINNRVMKALIEETDEKVCNCSDIEVNDACLLACIQAINHYKISTYGTAAAFAKTLGMLKPAAVFHKAEVNEKHIDDRLSQLAKFEINNRAKSPIVLPS